MESKWFTYFVLFLANIVSSEVKNLHSLRCLLENTFEPCIVFPDTSSHNMTVFSYKLIDEYAHLSADTHNAIELQNLGLISESDLEKIPDAMLFFLPANHISSINKLHLINLIIQRHNSSVVKHLVRAYLLGNGDEYLCEKLQTFDLPVRSLTWIANVISSDSHAAKKSINHPPLLFFSPPFSLLFNKTAEKLFYFSLWEKSIHISKEMNKAYLRFWTYATIKNSFPGPLNYWYDLCLERWGTLLTASTADELKLLNHSNIDNLQLLFSFGFSTIQMRTILEEFGEQLMNSRFDYLTLSKLLIDLLPEQLLIYPKIIPYFEQLKVLPSTKSIATSKQIFELLVFEKESGDVYGYPYISNFSYILPLKMLSDTIKQPFPLSSLIKIQSNHFSKSQLYILSSRSEVLDFNSPYIFECRDLIKVLPARDIIFNKTTSHILLNLLSEVEANNIPQSFSIFNKLWTMVGFSNVFKKILANRDSGILLEYIPSRVIAYYADNIFIIIGEHINSHTKLPDSFVSSLLVGLSEAEKKISLLNAKDSLAFLFNGISCDDISSLDPYDFVVFTSKYTEQRKTSGKDFPKALQQCFVEKLLAYIELKFSLFQGILGESKLSLLNEAEIDSIGGYIFSALPIKPVEKAKYSKRIIKTIGELSLSELIIATSISKLQGFGSVLVHNDFIAGKKLDFPLFDLGNLTLFLDKKYVTKINETYFQLLLESRFIDRRICTSKSSHLAWFNLLKRCFGETSNWTYQTLVTLGDLLIVVPDKEVEKIPPSSWKYAADVLMSHYSDVIEYHSPLKFYEACMLQLNSDNAQWFFNDLKRLAKWYADAAQLQLNTVTPAQELEKKNKPNDELFIFINSTKSKIKTLINSTQNVINDEKPIVMKNETEFNTTTSVNKDGIQFSTSVDTEGNESSSTPGPPDNYSNNLKSTTETTLYNESDYSTNYHNYVSVDTTMHLGFITETPFNENVYTTFNDNITTKEISEKTIHASETPTSIFISTPEVNRFYNIKTSTFYNVYEKYFNATTPSDYSILSNVSTSDRKNGPLNGYEFENNLNSDIKQNSTNAFQNKLTTFAVEITSETCNDVYEFNSSGFETDINDSLSESQLSTTPFNITSMNINNQNEVTNRSQSEVTTRGQTEVTSRSQTDDTTSRNFQELVTHSSDHNLKMSSTPISKPFSEKTQNEKNDMDEKQFESLLENNTKTQFFNLNISSFRPKLGENSTITTINNTREDTNRNQTEVTKGSQTEEVTKRSQTEEVTTRSQTEEVTTRSQTEEVTTRSQTEEVTTRSQTEEVTTRSQTEEVTTRSQTEEVTTRSQTSPRITEELVAYSSDNNSKMSSTKPFSEKIQYMEEKKFENLLKNNTKTQFLNFNFSSFRPKLGKYSPIITIYNTGEATNKTQTEVTEGSQTEVTKGRQTEVITRSQTEVTNRIPTEVTTRSQTEVTKGSQNEVTTRSQIDLTIPKISEGLVAYSSDHKSKMSSTKPFNEGMQNEIKDMEEKQFENLLNNNTNTQFFNLNISSFRSKLGKSSPFAIKNNTRGRIRRSTGQYSCEVLKMIGKLTEIIISEELIENMPDEDLNDCVDLLSEIDLPVKIKNLIWRKLKMDRIFLYGKLVSAINISDIQNMNFSFYAPWTFETINLIARYSTDPEVKEYVVKRITGARKLNYTPEILVTLGSLICKLPEISPRLIEPSDFLKASVILGRNLPCNYSCLQKVSNIAIKEGAFEDPLKWNAKDVSDLGIIIAGLERVHWKKLLHSKKKPLRGISEQAFKCLSREYIEELELQYNMNLSKIYPKNQDLFDRSVQFDFFGTTNDSYIEQNDIFISISVQLISFYLGFHLQIFFIAVLIVFNHF